MLNQLFARWRRTSVVDPVAQDPRVIDDDGFSPQASNSFASFCADEDGDPIWPDDPDEVPAWWYDRQAWAIVNGIKLPAYRTRREMEAMLARARAKEEGVTEVKIIGPFSPNVAAERFLDYLRASNPGTLHEFTATELSDVYAEYCAAENIEPTHVDLMKHELALAPGVSRPKQRRMIGGKRTQVTCWLIEPINPDDDAIDLTDLDCDHVEYEEPIRIAA